MPVVEQQEISEQELSRRKRRAERFGLPTDDASLKKMGSKVDRALGGTRSGQHSRSQPQQSGSGSQGGERFGRDAAYGAGAPPEPTPPEPTQASHVASPWERRREEKAVTSGGGGADSGRGDGFQDREGSRKQAAAPTRGEDRGQRQSVLPAWLTQKQQQGAPERPSGSSDGGGSGGFPWFDPSSTREANHRVSEDLYMLVSGLDYTGALGAWARVGGAPSLPPLAALGVWYSRYYPYGAASYQKDVLGEYAANGLPLSVGVLDVPWHNIDYAIADLGPDKNGSWPYPDVPGTAAPDAACNGWDGFTFNRTLFPDPAGFFEGVHAQGIKMILSVHMQNGIDHCQDQYLAMARAVGMSPEDIARNTTVACAMDDRKF